jgi:phosphocarrier protein FPr
VTATRTLVLRAPVSGVVVPLDDVPDAAFAQRLVGDGVAIDPLDAVVVAPCDAIVRHVHPAGHAVTLDADGLELVVHVGVDTVLLRGAGFETLVATGVRVAAGTPLLRCDVDLVARRARSLVTPVLVANMDAVLALDVIAVGRVRGGEDPLLRIVHAAARAPEVDSQRAAPLERSSPVVVAADTGLHARPAAALVAEARRFAAVLHLRKGERVANARSLVSIMALEVARGDAIVVEGQGPDARAAVEAIAALLARDLDAVAAGRTAEVARPAPLPHAGPPGPAGDAPIVAGVPLRGVGAAGGVAVGRIVRLRDDEPEIVRHATDAAHERRALDAAVTAAHRQLAALRTRLAAEADTAKAAIFAAHQELLEDPEVLDAAGAAIADGASAAWAWRAAVAAQADRVAALSSSVLAGRAADLRDVGRRVLHLLAGGTDTRPPLPADAIVVAEDLGPSDVAGFDRGALAGICTTMGSATSHVAILARGLGVPAVLGCDPRVLALADGTLAVIDGDAGHLVPDPDVALVAAIRDRRAEAGRRREADHAAAQRPAVTRDGHRIEVAANIGAIREAADVPTAGGDGVGLLRSEFLFMDRHEAPDEDEQHAAYAAVAQALGPDRPVIVRTLDVGGDKPLAFLPMAVEANPFLGERGVRVSLARPALFRVQLRAILRAAASGRVAVMFPMIATLAEWRAARALLEEERMTLGIAPVPVGIMVETAAAAMLADRFAAEADFLSIGTNDLTQYTLAMDRTNPRLAPQVDALSPAVLRLVERTVAGARAHGRWVGVCGALAGDAAAIPILVGLGVDELSVDVPLVPSVKARVRALDRAACIATARLALDLDDGAAIRALVAARHPDAELPA